MTDIYTQEATINGKTFRCVLNFSKYDPKSLKADFKEFIEYQHMLGKRSPEDNDLKIYQRMDIEKSGFEYEYFKNASMKYFCICIMQMLKDSPGLMITDSDVFVLEINVQRIKNRSFYFEYNDEDSDDGFASYNGAGVWFIQTIVAPLFFLHRIDYSIIIRYFAHELTHHSDNMKGYLEIERKYSKQIRKLTDDSSTYALNLLFTSINNLRDEGFADYNARLSGNFQEINMTGIKLFNANLEKLCTYKSRYRSTLYYSKNIGWQNLTASGEYSNGRYMCVTITLYFAILLKEQFEIIINKDRLSSADLVSGKINLNKILENNSIVRLSGFTQKTISEASNAIRKTQGANFLSLYEQACLDLKIRQENMVMTTSRYVQLVNKIKKNRKQ